MAITFNDKYNDLDWVIRYTASTTTIVTVGSSAMDKNFDIFNDTVGVGDAIIFGGHQTYGQYNELKLNISTALAATSITGVWEYPNTNSGYGSYSVMTWTALSGVTDGTNAFQNTGTNSITFTVPDDWANYVRPDSATASYYSWYIRFRVTAVTGLTEGGRVANVNDAAVIKYYSINPDNSYTSGSPLTFDAIYDADVAGGWGVVTKDGSSFVFHANLMIWYTTYLLTTQETITFTGNKHIVLRSGGLELHAGTVYSGDKVKNGSTFIFLSRQMNYPANKVLGSSSEVYNTQFRHDPAGVSGTGTYHNGYWGFGIGTNPSQKVGDVYVEGFRQIDFRETTNVVKGMTLSGGHLESPGSICDDITCFGGSYSMRPSSYNVGHYVHNSDMSAPITACVNPWEPTNANNWVMDFVNCKWGTFADTNRVYWQIPTTVTYANSLLYETYSTLFTVRDEKGNALSGATVALYDTNGTEVFSYTTNSDGVAGAESGTATSATASTLTDTSKSWSTDQWWFKEVLITGGTSAGMRRIVKKGNTATALPAHVDFVPTPDSTSRYVIVPYVRIKKYIPTSYVTGARWSTVTSYNPYTLIIKKTGYNTHKQSLTISGAVDWTIALERSVVTARTI